MKVVRPTPMMVAAAEAIEPVVEHVAVIGAAAVQVAVGRHTTAITPTTDVDMGLIERAVREGTVDEVIRSLCDANLEPSEEPSERGFTWVANGVKIQLVRGFAPFPKGRVKQLPEQPGIEDFFEARQAVAFEDSPETIRFWCADPASLLGLKRRAFGRSRADGKPVVRDYVDAYLLVRFAADEIVDLWTSLGVSVRTHAQQAIDALMDDRSVAVELGSLEMVKLGLAEDARGAAAEMRRAAGQLARLLNQQP